MMGGTSGSEAKLCQPFSSQSKTTQTRSSSVGSRKTVQPLEPCCLRFSAPLVVKTFKKRSKSSTFVVARIISLLLSRPAAKWPGSRQQDVHNAPPAHRADSLCGRYSVLNQAALAAVRSAADEG